MAVSDATGGPPAPRPASRAPVAEPQAPDRNRTTVRKALRAGALVGVAVMLVLAPTAFSADGPGGAVVVTAGFAAATLVTAGWLLLAAGLDLFAGEPMDLRRGLWTAAATLAAMLGPFLLLGALSQAAVRGLSG
jgi:hypothetical protein